MSAHDRHLAGHSTTLVHAYCRGCGHEWDDTYTEEYGQGWLDSSEDCPECGSTDIAIDPLDEQDIAELRAEARGEDF